MKNSHRRMRVEIVTDTFRPDINGVAMTLGYLVDGLKELGHWIHVTHTGEQSSKGETSAKSVSLPNYPDVKIGLPRKAKLIQRWQRKRPDVVYVATESPLGVSAIKAAKHLGIPVMAGFHTNFHSYLKQYKLGGMKDTAKRYLSRVHGLADGTLVPSLGLQKKLTNEGYRHVKLMGRGVDAELFSPAKRSAKLRDMWAADAETPVIMMAGRMAPEKNLELGLRCYREIQKQYPHARCVVVGDGPAREQLKLEYRDVIFAGVRKGEDLAQHYASADILLFPSETETFGNVLLEGMASGMVTVAYNYAAAREHVMDGKNGLLAPLGDEAMFIEQALKSLDLDRWADLRKSACQIVDRLSWRKVAIQFEMILADLILTTAKAGGKPNRDRGKRTNHGRSKMRVRTLFLSDLHLGTTDSKAREVVDVLKHIRCEKIVLNGDIIDGWALKRGGKWLSIHTRVIRALLKKMEKEKTEIVYIRGNHDDFMDRFIPISLDRLRFVKDYIHVTAKGDRYLVIHGDGFDNISSGHRWVSLLGSVSYEGLLRLNRIYNRYRSWRGKGYYSVSKAIKSKVKSAVSFVSKYEEKLVEMAQKRNCQGVICGHIHCPADEQKDGLHYLNSGDWVETLSCIVEDEQGRFSVLYYEDFLEQTLPDQSSFIREEEEIELIPYGQDQYGSVDFVA